MVRNASITLRTVLLAALLGLACIGSAYAGTITPALRASLATGGPHASSHYVIIHLDPINSPVLASDSWSSPPFQISIRQTQRSIEQFARDLSWTTAYRFRGLPFLTGRGDRHAIETLSKHPQVRAIGLDEATTTTTLEALPFMRNDEATSQYGLKGAGLTAAVFDTGIDLANADFTGRIVVGGAFLLAQNAQPTSGDIADGNGHGTNVAGILGSGGVNSAQGVAPEINLLVYKVLDDSGAGYTSDWAYAMDHAAGLGLAGLVVANLSLGTDTQFSTCPCGDPSVPWQSLLMGTTANLQSAGVLVVAATGNEALRGSMRMPGCLDQVVGVGAAYDDAGYPGPVAYANCTDTGIQADQVTCFTNMGQCLDILSVGSDLVTSAIPGQEGAGYSGTSQAAPAVAGAAALVFEQLPSRTADQVSGLLLGTGVVVNLAPDFNMNVPRLDVFEALALPTCGDGIVDVGEACDDGPSNGTSCCSNLCQLKANDSPCSSLDACTTGATCSAGLCLGGGVQDCSFLDGPCASGECVDVGGVATCESSPINTGVSCDDGSVCTSLTVCQQGACAGGQPLDCSAFDSPCTEGLCDPVGGCEQADKANGAACTDGDFCTVGDTCLAGSCAAGPPRDCSGVGTACHPGVCDEVAGSCVLQDLGGLAPCDDTNICTQDACDPVLGCSHVAISGPACSDGDACTTADTCAAGVCGGSPINCNDSNSCTDDSCDPFVGCNNAPNEALCSDSDACTTGDSCVNGDCIPGSIVGCEDNNLCTDDSCNSNTGCVNAPNQTSCDDGEDCTYGDLCAAGNCISGQDLSCDDGNSCTDDLCHLVFGCVYTPNNANECTDDTVCTISDYCSDGDCTFAFAVNCDDGKGCTVDSCNVFAGCQHDPNTLLCDDGDACTLGDQCAAGSCQPGDHTLNCNDGNACTLDVCIPNKGCVISPQVGPCVDGNACTTDDVCAGGFCIPGQFLSCDDGSPCTTDYCDGQLGCVYSFVQSVCTDENACTVGDVCQAGKCIGQGMFDCSDGNVCTSDTCQPGAGCIHVPNTIPCNDGNTCTLADTCIQGFCKPSGAMLCSDGNPCTVDTCLPGDGCSFSPQSGVCDDLNGCTTNDQCLGGACVGTGDVTCDDSNACTLDVCTANGGCSHSAIEGQCNDGNPCTIIDVCFAGLCKSGTQVNCDDGNPCTNDTCSANGTCAHQPNQAACSDGNACTTGDHCEDGICAKLAVSTCDDDNACTDDWCDVDFGCVNQTHGETCDDGNICTLGDVCKGLVCLPGTDSFDCDDGNECTFNECSAAGGCEAIPIGTTCDDGNECTASDTCAEGLCLGSPKLCNDGNPCTDDVCDPSVGCLFFPNIMPCSDGSECTKWDFCEESFCVGTLVDCDDGNWCTQDVCDILIGCMHPYNLKNCTDDDVCTFDDQCLGGKCHGTTLPCDDGNACTMDTCHPLSGCSFLPNVATCNDGDACTISDSCAFGKCVGDKLSCHDGNPCTDDACAPASGCLHTNNFDICDDSNACTLADRCEAGNCVGDVVICDDDNTCTDDLCDIGTGCTHTFNTSPCEDGLYCTVDQTCWDGACLGDVVRECGMYDKDCEASVCNEEAKSCVLVLRADGDPCEDGLFCSIDDQCVAGVCAAGIQRDCSAWTGEATVGVCKEAESRCAAVPSDGPLEPEEPDSAPDSDADVLTDDTSGPDATADTPPVVLVGNKTPSLGGGQVSGGCAQGDTRGGPLAWIALILALLAFWRARPARRTRQ